MESGKAARVAEEGYKAKKRKKGGYARTMKQMVRWVDGRVNR